ncbi:M24 family metallopeptidase [Sphingomonas sp.]|uniref:M24 family metallopeptidase n=1 Tax=Sphingomonas sp. TaxID=28214 RepID=UPI002CCEE9BF|nr:M24 family metallopeptidase [Sphingomonas sp.]HWK35265.1 M24 family metallopeptidase [Sphingomonas sp.]
MRTKRYSRFLTIGVAAVVAATGTAHAQAPAALNTQEVDRPAYPTVLTLREQAAVRDGWLKERLDTVIPDLLRRNNVDMWVLIARENFEDPVVQTMLDARSLHARRRTILVFYDPGPGKPIERITVSRYGLADFFKADWVPEKEPDQFKRLAQIIAERNPKTVAINSSSLTAYADGITLSQYQDMMAALPENLRARVKPDENLAVGWLETRVPGEMARYPEIVRLAHAIIGEALSEKVITPGRTTTDDVVWWMREKIAALKLATWFQPSVSAFRKGVKGDLSGDSVIQKGDMLWTDFGITYMGLNTDTQHLGYVLRDGETDVPAGLKAGRLANNRVQDALTSSFRVGDSGNAVLARARAKAIGEGLKPSIYSHPIGFHGHAAGASIGFWDNQDADPRGEYKLRPNTAWSIELSATAPVPEWDGQVVTFRSEEDAFFDGTGVRYIDGRQSDFHLVKPAR